MKLLIVDDEEKFVSRLAERLELRGYKADWATTYDEALFKVGMEAYDIAILDIKMPTMSGIDLKKNGRDSSEYEVYFCNRSRFRTRL